MQRAIITGPRGGRGEKDRPRPRERHTCEDNGNRFRSGFAGSAGLQDPRFRRTVDVLLVYDLYSSIYIAMKKEISPESFLPLKPHWFHVLLSLADQDQH